METLVRLDLPPGLARSGTSYQNRNRWINGHAMRWFEGALRPIGGWSLSRDTSGNEVLVVGKPRGSLTWRKNDATGWVAVGTSGTTSKLYAFSAGILTDITPAGLTNGNQDGFIATGVGLYGGGLYGDGLYGGGSQLGVLIDADTWSLDNFGEILVACFTADGKLYSSTPTAQATQITNSPTGCRALVVTPERFLFALGAGSDPRLVQWPDQQTLTTWTPSSSNKAGSFPLQTPGRIQSGRRTDRETLIWTDADLWAAVFIGGSLIYSFQQRGTNCGLIGPNAVAIAEGAAYWMGDGQFFTYAGAVRPIPCEVADYVFGDLNKDQKAKITAVPVTQFGEMWWFYPSKSQGTTLENDRYVSLNYRTGFWMTGNLGRASGSGAGVFATPLMWGTDGRLYAHETGNARDNVPAFVESGPLEIGTGDQVALVQKLLPDEKLLGQVGATFFTALYPMASESVNGPYTLTASTDVRATGRQIRLKLAEVPTTAVVTFVQVIVPIQDLFGDFTGAFPSVWFGNGPGGNITANLWSYLDENVDIGASPDPDGDGNFVEIVNNLGGGTAVYVTKFAPGTVPPGIPSVSLRYSVKNESGAMTQWLIEARQAYVNETNKGTLLGSWDDTAQILTLSVNTVISHVLPITPTDYTNLSVRITQVTPDGSRAQLQWMQYALGSAQVGSDFRIGSFRAGVIPQGRR